MSGLPATVPAPDLPAGPRAALIVATAAYADPGLSRLRAPTQDAAGLAEVLGDPAVGGFEVRTELDRKAHELKLAMEDFFVARKRADLAVVYLSCHGVRDARGRLYFAASDTRKDRLAATGVEASWLVDQLEWCKARQQVVILDCCFSGAFAANSKGDGKLDLAEHFTEARGRVILTASRAGEYSFEGEPLPDLSPTGSVFTNGLVEGLRTGAADRNHRGLVTVDEAFEYAAASVKATDRKQTPQRWLTAGEGQIILARNPAGVPLQRLELPESLRLPLDSPHPTIRIGSVQQLAEWLTSDDPNKVHTALLELREVVENDAAKVAAVAREILAAHAPANEAAVAATAAAPDPVLHEKLATAFVKTVVGRTIEEFADDDSRTEWDGLEARLPVPAPTPAPAPAPRVRQRLTIPDNTFRYVRRVDVRVAWTVDSTSALSFSPGAVAFTPNGSAVAVPGPYGQVLRWDSASGLELDALSPAMGMVGALASDPVDNIMVVGDTDGRVVVMDPEEDVRLFVVPDRSSDGADVTVLACALGKGVAVVGRDDGRWEVLRTDQPVRPVSGGQRPGRVRAVALAGDGRALAALSFVGNVVCQRLDGSYRPSGFMPLSVRGVTAIAFHPRDPRLLLTADQHSKLRYHKVGAAGALQRLTDTGQGGITALALDVAGNFLATAGADRSVKIWDSYAGTHLGTATGPDEGFTSLAFDPTGTLLAGRTTHGALVVWTVHPEDS
ncbi:caspase, EACC1-associated type [Yinghuangia soli]|uniref:Caspase family protein n=1 Tax=Yinghuangia soli TaxID=2908204 RepID=A0AA41PYK3_9ACTN|nr:caspase family protein [Yinghuangia soli]MCF2528041.1 caspase family protein [Yinghuangia soli]